MGVTWSGVQTITVGESCPHFDGVSKSDFQLRQRREGSGKENAG